MSWFSKLFGWNKYKQQVEYLLKVTLISYIDSIDAKSVEEFRNKLKAWIAKVQL